jgi:hypothetical protein
MAAVRAVPQVSRGAVVELATRGAARARSDRARRRRGFRRHVRRQHARVVRLAFATDDASLRRGPERLRESLASAA